MPATLEQISTAPEDTIVVVTDSTSRRRWRKAGETMVEVDGGASLPIRFFEGAASAGRVSIEGGEGEVAVARDPRPELGALRPDEPLVAGEVMTYGDGEEPALYYVLDPGNSDHSNCVVLYRSNDEEQFSLTPGQNLGHYIRDGARRWRRYSVEQAEHFFPEVSRVPQFKAIFERDLTTLVNQLTTRANQLRDAELMNILAVSNLGVAIHAIPVSITGRTALSLSTVNPQDFGVPANAEIGYFGEGYFDWTFETTIRKVGRGCQCNNLANRDYEAQLPEGARLVTASRGTCPTAGA